MPWLLKVTSVRSYFCADAGVVANATVKTTVRAFAHANRIRAFIGLPPWSLWPEAAAARDRAGELGAGGACTRGSDSRIVGGVQCTVALDMAAGD
jgi:hypothetical protein